MKLLIADNEPAVRSSIKQLLVNFCPEITIIEEASGVKEALHSLESFQPEILLLDVEMEDGTGFDLLKQIPQPSFQLIFITAHNQYAIEAFQFSAIDYLLKPVDPDALKKSIRRASANIFTKDLGRQIEVLLQEMTGKTDPGKRIVLKDLDNIYFIKLSEILYCMAEGTYTRFYIQGASPLVVSKNIKEYEKILEPLGFIRCHHSYLVNPNLIIRYEKTDGGQLILEGNHAVPVSQRKKDFILKSLENRS